jgi:hypothetical protein
MNADIPRMMQKRQPSLRFTASTLCIAIDVGLVSEVASDEGAGTMVNAPGTDWLQLGISCPCCGNTGLDEGPWTHNAFAPFRIIEDVPRAWVFIPKRAAECVIAAVDASRDHVDWESGFNPRIECMQCLAQFPLPAGLVVEFE